MTETDERELKVMKAKSQVDNAISSLKGILLGIRIDETVNEEEINELQKWIQAEYELIHRNPFKEFVTIIKLTASNKIPPKEAIQDLLWLCQKYESDSPYFDIVTADLQTLKGICHGILADGVINEKEVRDLNQWLKDNEHLNTHYPYDELRSIIFSIVSDTKIGDEEKLILKAYFNQFVELSDPKIQKQIKIETSDINITAHCTSDVNVIFPGKKFCITGIFNKVEREDIQNEIIDAGGIPTDTINHETDYLIVGDNGNPAWAFYCYGRKVEDALSLRKEGHTITLIHEFDFSDILDDMV